MKRKDLVNNPKLPRHIAFIVDGNGRWAKKRGLIRSEGHKAGFENLKKIVKEVNSLGIKNISLYCFSSENWNRPQDEVDYLMKLFDRMIDEFRAEYMDKDIRFMLSGDLNDNRLPKELVEKAHKLIDDTKHKTDFIVNVCINYGGRQEILKAINEIIASGETDITMDKFNAHLYTKDLLPLDFVVRTSGEQRTSNFMPWQSTYSEWYFPKKCFPSFSIRDLWKAVTVFMKRNRRFGTIK